MVNCAPAIVVAQSTALDPPGTITRLLNLNGALSNERDATEVPSSLIVKAKTGVPFAAVKVDGVEALELLRVKVLANAVVVVVFAVAGEVR